MRKQKRLYKSNIDPWHPFPSVSQHNDQIDKGAQQKSPVSRCHQDLKVNSSSTKCESIELPNIPCLLASIHPFLEQGKLWNKQSTLKRLRDT